MKTRLPILSVETVVEKTTETIRDIDFQWGLHIPMRDGIHLNATLYKPKAADPVPVIITLTPYIADSYHPRAYYFAQRGYAFMLVDCRGRGNSGGDFEPFVNEGRDGSDLVTWAAQQPWCDGQVTMWGGSYGGFDQWMTLKEFPENLKTIVPVAAAHAAVDFPFQNNFFYSYEIQWQTLTSGKTGNAAVFGEQSLWIDKFQEWYRSGRPFVDLDQIAGNQSTHFRTWLEHPTLDDYWRQMWLTPGEYARISQPILTITGHYDGDQPGAMYYYRQHMLHGSPEAKANHFLVIGPWDHAGTRTPEREFGGRKFGEAMLVDMNKLHQEWYDWTLKGGQKPEFLKDRVAWYVMGAEEWKYAPDLESIAKEKRRFYLNSAGGQANDVFNSGWMEETPPGDSPPDRYVYDPLDLRPGDLEKDEIKDYLIDQTYELNLFGQGLVYHSLPFAEDTEISGFVRLVVWLAIDQPDTDFYASLSVITPGGMHFRLAEDFLRARYRNSLDEQTLVTPGTIEQYIFERFTFFSQKVLKGSRLRLTLRAPNSIYFEKNYNAGGVVAHESAQDARTVKVTLFHDPEHPSYLEIPIS